MADNIDRLAVENNTAAQRYEAHVKEGLAYLDYERQGDTFILTHTEVPEEIEGQGIGHALVQAALDDARKHHMQVVPLCPFVARFIAERPEYNEIVARE